MGKNDGLIIAGVVVGGLILGYVTGFFCKIQATANTPLCRNLTSPAQQNLYQQRYNIHQGARNYQHQLAHQAGFM